MSTYRDRRSGVILLTAAGMIFVLLAFVGLAFDVGYMQWQRRRAQNAADGAAMDAAWAMVAGGSPTAKGQAGAALNGFTDGVDGITVTINNPPLQGSYHGNSKYVEAIVSQDQPSFFLQALNWSTLPVRARAVANSVGFDESCVIALDSGASPGIKFAGNVNLSFGCGVLSESSANGATEIKGNTTITMTNGATVGSVGTTTLSNGGTVTPTGSTASGLNSPGDPLSTLPLPAPDLTTNCYQGTTLGMAAGPCDDHSGETPTAGNYYPGVYCGGIQISSGGSFHFAPGIYIIAGGDMKITTTGTLSGDGVTFYLTNTTGWNCSKNGQIGSPNMSGQAVINWNAPLTGTYAGILMFANRALTPSPKTGTINGGSNSTLNGAFYFPNTDLNFSGVSSVDGYMMVIANTVDFTGTTTINILNFPTAFVDNNTAFQKWVTMAE
jgi:hypothetical protein